MTLIKSFEEQVQKSSDNIAVKDGKISITYNELNTRANRLAHILIKERQTTDKGQAVVLLFQHGAAMIYGVMGALKAGMAYVPLDPEHPLSRLMYVIKDSGAKTIITDSGNIEKAMKLKEEYMKVINIDEQYESLPQDNPCLKAEPDQVAVVLYTSGSTGNPKGVIQTHKNIMHFIKVFSNTLNIGESDRIALFTSYSHAVSVIDIFSALLNGACIHPYKIRVGGSIEGIAEWLKDELITVYHTVPTVYRYCMNNLKQDEILDRIRLVILGGETVSKNDVEMYKRHFPDNSLFVNLFGSSEVLLASSFIIDKQTEITGATVPIGYIAEGVEVYLLNENDEEARVFEIGEMVYKSCFLSPGYWNLPQVTARVFVEDNIAGEGKLFRSGDLARILPDETLEYKGRKDFQVKLNGYRIEIEEIELALDNVEEIRKSVVIHEKEDEEDSYLVAYYETVNGIKKDEADLKDILKEKLPQYMIPGHFVFLENIPLTQNGKIDRKALQGFEGCEDSKEFVAPQNEMEEKLANLWKDILGTDRIGVNDNFFESGGNSLKATTLISKIKLIFQVDVSMSEAFDNQTVRKLAKLVKNKRKELDEISSLIKSIKQMDKDKIREVLDRNNECF